MHLCHISSIYHINHINMHVSLQLVKHIVQFAQMMYWPQWLLQETAHPHQMHVVP